MNPFRKGLPGVAALVLAACAQASTSVPPPSAAPSAPPATEGFAPSLSPLAPPSSAPAGVFPGPVTKTSGCRMSGADPDRGCTPGALNPAVTQGTIRSTICVSGYTATIRPPVSESDRLKRVSGAEYAIADSLSNYEGDHLISLELGGAADDIANFWDQPHTLVFPDGTSAGSSVKDKFENYLHARVCSGRESLLDAQRAIASDWYGAWVAAGRPA